MKSLVLSAICYIFFAFNGALAAPCPPGRAYSTSARDIVTLSTSNDARVYSECLEKELGLPPSLPGLCQSRGKIVYITRVQSHNVVRVDYIGPPSADWWIPSERWSAYVRLAGIADDIPEHQRRAAMDLLEGFGAMAFFYENTECAPIPAPLEALPTRAGLLFSLHGESFSDRLLKSGLVTFDDPRGCLETRATACMKNLERLGAATPHPGRMTISQRADLNGDGKIDTLDLRTISKFPPLKSLRLARGDIDADGTIDSYDLYRLRRLVAGSLPLDVAYPIRDLSLESRGHTFDEDLSAIGQAQKPLLRDLEHGFAWRIRYERKGDTRRHCRPPLLNITFDKDFPLFNGLSVLSPSGLGYQEIRLISECDYLKDFRTPRMAPFLPGVLMREYLVAGFMRAQNVASLDTVGFAEVRFDNPTSARDQGQIDKILGSYYPGESYRYLLVQRDNEEDDETPFFTQFSLDPDILKNSDLYSAYPELTWDDLGSLHSLVGPYYYTVGGIRHLVPLDPESTLRYLILMEFLGVADQGPFQNQDYGARLNSKGTRSGTWQIIPYGMDLSLVNIASVGTPPEIFLGASPQTLKWLRKNGYLDRYFQIGHDIFSRDDNLHELLLLVDRYPFPCDRVRLKAFLRENFAVYRAFFHSPVAP